MSIPSNRPVVMGSRGMAASAHPLASMAGLRVLMDGGNAFDAAVATAACIGVVEPFMSGAGGIGVALAWVAREKRMRVLNFSGRAPAAAEPDRFSDETKENGALASLVPGNVAGWLALRDAYGTMELGRLLAPAIEYAEGGFPLMAFGARMFADLGARLARFPDSIGLIHPEGRPPRAGERFRNAPLADSLRRIVKGGRETFYQGELGERLVRGSRERGGLLTRDDLASYEARWQEPISVRYRGFEIFAAPPNSSGFQILQTLKLMEGFRPDELASGDPETLHLLMEAVKLCVADRIKFAGDPDHVRAPLRGLLSDAYAERRRKRIDPRAAAIVPGEHYARRVPAGALTAGTPEEFDGGMTTHFIAADREGNVVSVTQTLGGGFGCGIAVGGTGIFLNNMCKWFDLEEGSPNRIGAGKRVDFVCTPTHTLKDGRFHLSLGTPGSWGILQTTPQMLMNVLDHGLDVQQAVEAPRFRYTTGRRVQMEERYPAGVREALAAKGHEIELIEPWSVLVGGAQAVHFDERQGAFHGGADPRRDGAAVGW